MKQVSIPPAHTVQSHPAEMVLPTSHPACARRRFAAWIVFLSLLALLALFIRWSTTYIERRWAELKRGDDLRWLEALAARRAIDEKMYDERGNAVGGPAEIEEATGLVLMHVKRLDLAPDPALDYYTVQVPGHPMIFRLYFRNGALWRSYTDVYWPELKRPRWWSWPEPMRHYTLLIALAMWMLVIVGAFYERHFRRRFAQWALALALVCLAMFWIEPPPGKRRFVFHVPHSLYVGGTMVLVSLIGFIRRKPRPIDICPHCSYNLFGNESGVCPECGNITPAEMKRQHDAAAAGYAQAVDHVDGYNPPNVEDDRMDGQECEVVGSDAIANEGEICPHPG
jgi:hypothetical protein